MIMMISILWPCLLAGPFGVAPPALGGCPILPANNVWNTPIDNLPVDPNSDAYIQSIGPHTGLHPDFGTVWKGAPIGIPYVVVPATQPPVEVVFIWYPTESDPGPYPVPPDAPIEGGPESDGDRHVLVVQQDACILYELYYALPQPNGTWEAGCGAVFDLNSNTLRPDGWTSADAAGLPILPGLVRYEEVIAGEINHALRFTAEFTRDAHVWPARHDASDDSDPDLPPMGQRFRLKAGFDITPYPPEVQVILIALKKYGMMLADNGSDWYITGVPNSNWNDDNLHELGNVKGSDFEAVDVSSLMVDPDSGAVNPCFAADVAPSGGGGGGGVGDGQIDIDDLFAVIGAWNTADAQFDIAPAETGGDGIVNIDDLFAVIAAWGPCP